MDALTETLMSQLSQGGLSAVGQKIGADERTAASALSTAVPLLVAALARNASTTEGAASLQQALVKDHDGSILEHVTDFLGNPEAANGAGILRHVLGHQQVTVQQGLSRSLGLESNQIGTLLQIAAPLLMGALGKQQQQQGFDLGSLASFLGGQQQAVQQSNPDIMSLLTGKQSGLSGILGLLSKLFGGR